MTLVYLDNNATTQPAPEVRAVIEPFLATLWGNPSSMHHFGGQVRRHVERAREQVAALIAAEPSEIIFTGCGTEGDNTAVLGGLPTQTAACRVITTRVEHPAVLAPCRHLAANGHFVTELGVDALGRLDEAELVEALQTGGKALVSVMWANNETGVVFPIERIAGMVSEWGGVMHTDAVQAAGKVPIDVRRAPIDMLTISGHKLHGPKGIGALYVRKGVRVRPLLLGGHQENNRRAGTENVAGIVALGAACELAMQTMAADHDRMAALRDRLETGLLQRCRDARVNGDCAQRLPNTTSISFAYIEGEAILYHLSDAGIAASSGSACTSGSLEPSHVLRAMGVPFTMVNGSIRFSLSRYTTGAEIDRVLEVVPRVVERLRMLSPFSAPAAS